MHLKSVAYSFSWILCEIAEISKQQTQLNSFHIGIKPHAGASLHPPPPGQYSHQFVQIAASHSYNDCRLKITSLTWGAFLSRREYFLITFFILTLSLYICLCCSCVIHLHMLQVTKWYWDALHSGLKYRLANSLLTSKLHQIPCSLQHRT